MQENYPNANVVISSTIYFDEIKRQLEVLGFPEDRILSYKMFLPDEITWQDVEKNVNYEKMKIRARQFSEWIDESVRSVVDYGANEMFLKTLLLPGVAYFPIDYIRRSDETILCDLNSGVFPDIHTDVAVLSGVLEYLTTAKLLLCHVCKTTKYKILLSYMTFDKFPDIDGRRASAYVSDLTERQIIDLLAQRGFNLKNKQADSAHDVNTLFLFEKLIC